MNASAELLLPRADWAHHPRFPHQTLLLGGHAGFRRTSRSLVDSSSAGRSPRGLLWVFRTWKAAMHSHERYEETKLYPYLEARWGLSMEPARSGHDVLARCERDVLAAAAAGGDRFEATLRAHDEVLCAHLDLEEQLVIPALLALEPEEFDDYIHSDIRGLLQRLEARTA